MFLLSKFKSFLRTCNHLCILILMSLKNPTVDVISSSFKDELSRPCFRHHIDVKAFQYSCCPDATALFLLLRYHALLQHILLSIQHDFYNIHIAIMGLCIFTMNMVTSR